MMPFQHSYHLIYKMNVLECASLLFLLIVRECHGTPYQPGDKGGRWTDDQAEIIRDKLLYLWANSNKYINRLIEIKFEDVGGKLKETRNSGAQSNYTDYYYDPVIPGVFKNGRLSTVDCINPNESLCRGYWSGKRMSNLQFTEPKAIRLAFHDVSHIKIQMEDPRLEDVTGASTLTRMLLKITYYNQVLLFL